MPSFANIRVIAALMLREMTTRYGRSPGGYIWAVVEPIGFIFVLTLVFSTVVRTPPLGTNFPLFFATGYLTFQFYMEISSFASSAIIMNRPLLTYPRVTPIDAIISRVVLQFVTLCVVSILLLSGIIIYYDIHTIFDFVAMIKAVLLATLFGTGVGVANTVIFAYVPAYENVFKIISRPMFLISGVFFVYEDLPNAAQDLLWFNPVVHAVGLFRAGFYPTYEPAYVSELYIGGAGAFFLVTGLFFLSKNKTAILELR